MVTEFAEVKLGYLRDIRRLFDLGSGVQISKLAGRVPLPSVCRFPGKF
jgi:hypothetical protein